MEESGSDPFYDNIPALIWRDWGELRYRSIYGQQPAWTQTATNPCQTTKLNIHLAISQLHRLYNLPVIYRTVRQKYNVTYCCKIECNFNLFQSYFLVISHSILYTIIRIIIIIIIIVSVNERQSEWVVWAKVQTFWFKNILVWLNALHSVYLGFEISEIDFIMASFGRNM